MAELLTVGEFSRLTHLTVKALHQYHEVGGLEPALIDPFTGYRYYALHQVEAAHLVRRLREVRMPVPQVRVVLAAPDGPTSVCDGRSARGHRQRAGGRALRRHLVRGRRAGG